MPECVRYEWTVCWESDWRGAEPKHTCLHSMDAWPILAPILLRGVVMTLAVSHYPSMKPWPSSLDS